MNIQLEVTGGFTGKAGKQSICLELEKIPDGVATEIRSLLGSIPPSAWGGSFLSNHPRPWDFKQELTVREEGKERTVTFHKGQGPAELTKLTEKILECGAPTA